jgi:hypothetical protein
MKSARFLAVVVTLVFLVLTNSTFAVLVHDIQGTLLQTQWYNGSTDNFQTNYIGGSYPAQIDFLGFSTVNSSSIQYWMLDGTFSLGPSVLIDDQTATNGGRAKGIFASGATLTVSGDLYRDSDFEKIASGDLIVAEIMYDWRLEEMVVNPYPANTVCGHAFFNITGGALSNSSLNLDGLVMNDFCLSFTFELCAPTVTDFATTTATYTCHTPKLLFDVPEPTSVMLMGLGVLAIFRRKSN